MPKYIFITGGVFSSLGKGVATASIASGLKNKCGLNIRILKLDPYFNTDPGTMSPGEHGEVYVLEDGTECDLDLGHYERMTGIKCDRRSNYTSGQIYNAVIENERRGDYLGKTVQLVPHVTDEIKHRIRGAANSDTDVVIIELGGTIGDDEGLPFVRAISEFIMDNQGDCVLIHLVPILYLPHCKEYKTKPAQYSVNLLQEKGLRPDFLLCRINKAGGLTPELRNKFHTIGFDKIFEAVDTKNIYEIVNVWLKNGFLEAVAARIGFDLHDTCPMPSGNNRFNNKSIALVGKYRHYTEAYKSIIESVKLISNPHIDYICSEDIVSGDILDGYSGVIIPGGFGNRGTDGKILAAQYCREHRIPCLGICLGMQVMAIEFARNVLGLYEADSTEFGDTKHKVICLAEEFANTDGVMQRRDERSNKGGTMRLGSYPYKFKGKVSTDRHRHRYEFNNWYRELFEEHFDLGVSLDDRFVEIMQLKDHPFYIGCQFHPEFNSTIHKPHWLFEGFLLWGI